MQLAVSYNQTGEITLMFDPSKLVSDKFTVSYQPAQGENHRVFDVSAKLQGKSIEELASTLHVNVNGRAPVLELRG